ncbi:MAG: bifunctional glutamate N-acetyltransferase/amino-acid acetyltransferase ArgJ [Rhodobacteraceae bacterium]|nr:bifunctional glutamate N-acetyltransferase/amino-acid acetyltransferase ArgJ [Paracoccaceae bacterium]MBL6640451.1 bifunctional glutamate N-acetyltransferase/amino-acid acetyltransferase ArgJ [Paracoccaceae bacterium]MBL6676316.1 bifunctional glutamate N-acetyltransferase/amino-acid acetyltransferase ArgJ [Paracoccaceae bacterium]MBL6789387.1 bifunctional glutamate N-acetyltransferase/amino-acid acetyltransferase ArgJ [Paracoccaceae bacterium]MBL6860154.1 bifunctional glutamate N-acetyltrans
MAKSPLAPAQFPALPNVAGVRFGTLAAGIKYQNRPDVMLAELAPGTSIAGVFTQSATRSAAVLDCQKKLGLPAAEGAAILVNSGNANAFTGHRGMASVAALSKALADQLELSESRVFTASTGVIGEPLPHEKISTRMPELISDLDAEGIAMAARAIMTTDTYPKGASAQVETSSGPVNIVGIAKGSGMIAPDMATMLAYIFTDAQIEQVELQGLLSSLNEVTFNAITVDSDTSTSDTLILAATGASGHRVSAQNAAFVEGLHQVMRDLAHQVVRDGEGARKFVEVRLTGAASDQDAKQHAKAIANSPLVKTALAGEDPNWGRIVMALGKSGAAAERDLIKIWLGDILVAEQGWVAASYSEEQGAAYMKNAELVIAVDLGMGSGAATVWTCDLTHDYISINADYRS